MPFLLLPSLKRPNMPLSALIQWSLPSSGPSPTDLAAAGAKLPWLKGRCSYLPCWSRAGMQGWRSLGESQAGLYAAVIHIPVSDGARSKSDPSLVGLCAFPGPWPHSALMLSWQDQFRARLYGEASGAVGLRKVLLALLTALWQGTISWASPQGAEDWSSTPLSFFVKAACK